MKKLILTVLLAVTAMLVPATATAGGEFTPGELWLDNNGNHINAHGGGVMYYDGTYYWFGEHKADTTSSAMVGVTCYSSTNLTDWTYRGVALSVVDEKGSDIERGCILERPKVVYNKKTGKFVMWFHLELKGQGYAAARYGVAVSDTPTGPYRFIRSGRVNPGKLPVEMTAADKAVMDTLDAEKYKDWWTPAWHDAIRKGLLFKRDLPGGQMARDQTVYVDDDGKAYHIYSSEENLTLQIAELTDDYTAHTGRYTRVAPGGQNEAPAIFKKDGTYWMITSGCTGWAPNKARMFTAKSIWGPWKQLDTPCVGPDADKTFGGQSTYILNVEGTDTFIFMADIWRPEHPSDARYIWLPIKFKDGRPVVEWTDKWSLGNDGWKLVWSDEFNRDGKPDTTVWNYEHGFVRNEEDQWYTDRNAYCTGGVLVIEARKERVDNPRYDASGANWQLNRRHAEYTSASINTAGKFEFKYGRLEVRARIPVGCGAWPAIWTLGSKQEWPSCGEIDVMEFYRIKGVPSILANVAWGRDRRYDAEWRSSATPYSHFLAKDSLWAEKFHVWRMDWDEEAIRLYLDGELLNEVMLDGTINGECGNHTNPFRQPHYVLLNLALGGTNGGEIDNDAMPMKYEVDYVRVYRK